MDKKIPFLILIAVLCFSLGCISVGTREIIMPDQEMIGNQGYLDGSPSSIYRGREVKKKKIYDIEIEIPDLFQEKTSFSYDQTIWGNQGYLQKENAEMSRIYVAPKKKSLPVIELEEVYESEDDIEPLSSYSQEPAEPDRVEYMDYVVVEGDSLWIIAKRVYGDAAKWDLISDNNQDVLKGRKYLKPGMILKLPVLDENRVQYIK
ncbi:MAG: LysM peptidoglycan-binding domain-containing protein [Candidatus Kaelpia imicola]|nr:LysM peptidoglycan-binding domain-containing protein [Candidatus Kaelpia imicola]